MNAAQTLTCSMEKWIDTEMQSNGNSGTTSRLNLDECEDRECSPTTTNSSLEVNNTTNAFSLSNPKESSTKTVEGAIKSYAMKDLLRNDAQTKRQRKQPVPTQKFVVDEPLDGTSRKDPSDIENAVDDIMKNIAESTVLDPAQTRIVITNALKSAVEKMKESNAHIPGNENENNPHIPVPMEETSSGEVIEHMKERKIAQAASHLFDQAPNPPPVHWPADFMKFMHGNIPEVFNNPFLPLKEIPERDNSFAKMQKMLATFKSACILPEPKMNPLPIEVPGRPLNASVMSESINNQTEALSLVVDRDPSNNNSAILDSTHGFENSIISSMPRKKRTKVTDTRLIPPKMSQNGPVPPMDNVHPFQLPDSQKSGMNGTLFPIMGSPGFCFNLDPSILEFVKSMPFLNSSNSSPLPINPNRNVPTQPLARFPQLDLMRNFIAQTQPQFPRALSPLHINLHQQQQPILRPPAVNAFPFDMSGSSGLSEPGPIRRNRSIGGRRVTNTASMVNYGCDARSFRPTISNSEEGTSRLHSFPPAVAMTTTLTPVHLRKAKLMFFYTRYPNSNLLKTYFIDVEFQKQNTAQLVKWFSNFREFYYIQMEKYARTAISQGIRNPSDITVSTDSELYRNLALHYNRNQQIEIPEHFRLVVETTLREFFVALSTGKDAEQSWKKPIYKIIARMDQPLPEFFKDPSWIAQLAEG